jgi:hypothetical protein
MIIIIALLLPLAKPDDIPAFVRVSKAKEMSWYPLCSFPFFFRLPVLLGLGCALYTATWFLLGIVGGQGCQYSQRTEKGTRVVSHDDDEQQNDG